jgi:hypothetical protein
VGQITRMNRAKRFIKEFGKDILAQNTLKVGTKLTVRKVALGRWERDASVVTYYVLEDEDGTQYEFNDGGVLFDPEYGDLEDTAHGLAGLLGISEKQAEQRLRRADLV